MDWRAYQLAASKFFDSLGMDTEVDQTLVGSRSEHAIDVVVRFTAFGVEHLWVVECKLWNRSVPKQQVLILKGVCEDVGADRGFLLSESGFQSGAVTAAQLSSITLTNLEDLQANARANVQAIRWDDLYSRLAKFRNNVASLTEVTKEGAHAGDSHLKPGISSDEFFGRVGTASILDRGLERARLGQFPIVYGPDETGEGAAVASDMDSFLDAAADVLAELEAWIDIQVALPWPDRPEPVDGTRPGSPTLVFDEEEAEELGKKQER